MTALEIIACGYSIPAALFGSAVAIRAETARPLPGRWSARWWRVVLVAGTVTGLMWGPILVGVLMKRDRRS